MAAGGDEFAVRYAMPEALGTPPRDYSKQNGRCREERVSGALGRPHVVAGRKSCVVAGVLACLRRPGATLFSALLLLGLCFRRGVFLMS